jgi:hypothetical protein
MPAPSSIHNGQWIVAFFAPDGGYVNGAGIPFRPATVPAGSGTADGGAFSVDVTSFGSGSVELDAFYDGGTSAWPAVAHVRR